MKVGIAWECPWVPSSYGKLSLWLASELQRMGVDVRIYCPSAPETQLYSNRTLYKPECQHGELGICVELEKPIEVYNAGWLCGDEDVDVYVVCGAPYGATESEWIARCSKSSKPVAGYFVTESAIVPSILANWLFLVDATGFTTRAVARAYLVHDAVREFHSDWVLVPHGLPEYYFKLDPEEVFEYAMKLYEKRGLSNDPGLKLVLESRSEGVLYGTVGKDHPRKDYGALLSAFALLKRLCAERWGFCDKVRLLLGFVKAVGVPTWQVNMLMDLLGLESNDVVILAEEFQRRGITEMALLFLYSAMDAFVLATMGEGWGLPPLEAAALGRPVVVTKTPVTEEVWDGYPLLAESRPVVFPEGYILYQTDYRDLAEKMAKLLSSRARRHYGRLARQVAERYTARRMAESFLKLVDLAIQRCGVKKQYPLEKPLTQITGGYRSVVLEVLKLA